jgi:hypothetical protein
MRLAAQGRAETARPFRASSAPSRALGDEDLREVGVGAPFGQAADIIVIPLGCVSRCWIRATPPSSIPAGHQREAAPRRQDCGPQPFHSALSLRAILWRQT